MSTQTRSWADVIKSHIAAHTNTVYTSLPAIVQSYDSTAQTVKVTLGVSQKLPDGRSIPAATLSNVHVDFPYGAGFRMGWNLNKGDNVMLHFSMRSLDEWRNSNGKTPVSPVSDRRHDRNDVFAVAGGSPRTTIDQNYKDNTHLADDETYLVFNENNDNGLLIKSDKGVIIESTTEITLRAPKVIIDAPLTECTGNLTVDGTIDATGVIHSDIDVTGIDTSLETHIHTTTATVGASPTVGTISPPTP